jgi:hypothetical protein
MADATKRERVEHQQHVLLAPEIGQAYFLVILVLQREIGRDLTNGDRHDEAPRNRSEENPLPSMPRVRPEVSA